MPRLNKTSRVVCRTLRETFEYFVNALENTPKGTLELGFRLFSDDQGTGFVTSYRGDDGIFFSFLNYPNPNYVRLIIRGRKDGQTKEKLTSVIKMVSAESLTSDHGAWMDLFNRSAVYLIVTYDIQVSES